MVLALSSADLARLEVAFTTLLSPLRYDCLGAWRVEARARLAELLGADRSASMLPLAGEPLGEEPADFAAAIAVYQAYYRKLGAGLRLRQREPGLEVWCWPRMDAERTVPDAENRESWSHTSGLLDAICISTVVDPSLPPAAIFLFRERSDSPTFGERGLALLRLLLPAFKAGVATCLRLAQRRHDLTYAIDTLEEPLAIFDRVGHLVHANPALTTMLASEAEGRHILGTARQVAITVAQRAEPREHGLDGANRIAVRRELCTCRGRYRMWGNSLGSEHLARGLSVMVAVERVAPVPLSDDALAQRFHLTSRERETAHLLAHGETNAAIAAMLGIGVRTVEHHVEHVLLKLGLHSRAGVGALLRGGS